MAKIQLAGVDALTESSGVVSLAASVVQTGHMVYIKHVATNGYGAIGDQQNWYPLDMSGADANKTLYITVSGTEHAPYSKLKIDFTFDMRIDKVSHAFCDSRLARWQGSTTIPGTPTTLSQSQFGVVAGGSESYDNIAGSVIDDISGLSNTIYYAIQMRNAAGSAAYAGQMYFGNTDSRTQMIIYGIY